jgi:uncharacterized hydrophobic protein (TIGR00271 family)
MTVLAVISDESAIPLVLPWACAFAKARSLPLTVACWTHSPLVSSDDSDRQSEDLAEAAREYLSDSGISAPPEVFGVSGPSEASAVIGIARQKDVDLIVAAGKDATGTTGATFATNPLLKQSPCNTVILFADSARSTEPGRIFVGATDSPHDAAALFLARGLADACDARVTLARAETGSSSEDLEIGRRELKQLMRDAGVDDDNWLDRSVFDAGDRQSIAAAMDQHDLVLLGANCPLVPALVELTQRPTVAIVRRAPPLRPWHLHKSSTAWNPRLTAADYADLIQGLRQGSKLGTDFVTMLCLATVVASVGLLQDSPAVVIGSMLLAPLMTPMIGCGFALAQANQSLGRRALATIVVGLLLTLSISFIIGLITPGAELTPQVYARGEPTVLDLIVALASAAAAAYALARPNLVGSIAGVAIATALVPPLCSVGLSIAYQDFQNAFGASLLFLTNFLAIVLGAAITFSLIGITAAHADSRQKRWVFRVAGILGITTIAICVPLQNALVGSLVETKPQPRAYPLAKVVIDAIEDRVEAHPNAWLISAGLASSRLASSDVVLIIGSTKEIDASFADELVETVRQQMRDDSLIVEVHCVDEHWHETSH